MPILVAGDLARGVAHRGGEGVDLATGAFAQGAGIGAEQLGVAQHRVVAILPERPVAGGVGLHRLEEIGVRLEGGRSLGAGRGKLGTVGRFDLLRQQLARVVGAGARLVDGTLEEQRRHQRRAEVGATGVQLRRDPPQPPDGALHQLGLRAKPMQEEDEDALQAGVHVGVRVAPPVLPLVVDGSLGEAGDEQVAVDRLVEGEVGRVDRAKARQPGVVRVAAPCERGGRQVVKPVVIGRQAEGAGLHRMLGVVLGQELGGEVGE